MHTLHTPLYYSVNPLLTLDKAEIESLIHIDIHNIIYEMVYSKVDFCQNATFKYV